MLQAQQTIYIVISEDTRDYNCDTGKYLNTFQVEAKLFAGHSTGEKLYEESIPEVEPAMTDAYHQHNLAFAAMQERAEIVALGAGRAYQSLGYRVELRHEIVKH